MPLRSRSICATPGCPNLTNGQWCIRCRQRARQQRQTSQYDDAAWRKTSAAFLLAHPLCEAEACPWPASQVHHRDGRGPEGERGHDWDNLEALCRAHHGQITGKTVGFGSPKTK